ncbi:hypothetical protein KKG71_05225 [Patescibacteria group bacterium]|nr:hypothetical protein [Patescibacteria group bacterium]
MSESPAPIEIQQVKKDLIDPRTISKNNDQEGRDKLASEIRESRTLRDEIKKTEVKLDERQETILVKIKDKLNIPDKQKIELEEQLLEQRTKQDGLPDPKKMIEAYYEKTSETPLTNQEKRDLLKPEVLAQLSTDEYVALWKRLNPHFLTHVTRQGFRDHNAMFYHSAGLQEFHDGLLNIVKDEKQLRPPLALGGLKARDEVSVKMFLSEWALQAENEEEATKRFDSQLHWSLASAPTYPDKTAVHFAAQLAADDYYGGEKQNEAFFVFPSDVIASQHNFAFNGWEKDFTHPQSETKWNDVFIWPNSQENPGISIDAGVAFLPEKVQVDPNTGSKYASEVKSIDGVDKKVMIEDVGLKNKFNEWAKELNDESEVIKFARAYYNERSYDAQKYMGETFDRMCLEEIVKLGFDTDSARMILPSLTQSIMYWNKDVPEGKFQEIIDGSSAKYKKAENTIPAKEYWEDYFSKNPDLKPKHIIYYDGDPTNAVYKFQQENNIGSADTSKVDGQLLAFDDHHITDMTNDPRANIGHQELVNLGNRIIKEHYQNKV